MNTTNILNSIRLIPTALAIAPVMALAGPSTPAPIITPEPTDSGWTYRIEPYAWLTGLSGATGVADQTTDVDTSFGDITDVIKMAAALELEARNGKWGICADIFWSELGGEASLTRDHLKELDLDMQQLIGELTIAYRTNESPKGFLDLFAGARYNRMKLDFEAKGTKTSIDGSADEEWVDPIIGFRGQYNINEKWALAGNADIGGFGVSSDLTWSVEGTVVYNFSECIYTELGYRYLHTDYQEDFVYDMNQKGLFLGLGFVF